jgi:hypothetical protein
VERTETRSLCASFEESKVEVELMRIFWERAGVLGPVYRLAGQGLSDVDIANKLNLTEVKVADCIAWILHFLKFTDRIELIRYASVRETS